MIMILWVKSYCRRRLDKKKKKKKKNRTIEQDHNNSKGCGTSCQPLPRPPSPFIK